MYWDENLSALAFNAQFEMSFYQPNSHLQKSALLPKKNKVAVNNLTVFYFPRKGCLLWLAIRSSTCIILHGGENLNSIGNTVP